MTGPWRIVRIEPDETTSDLGMKFDHPENAAAQMADLYSQQDEDRGVDFQIEPPLTDAWAYAVPAQNEPMITQGAIQDA